MKRPASKIKLRVLLILVYKQMLRKLTESSKLVAVDYIITEGNSDKGLISACRWRIIFLEENTAVASFLISPKIKKSCVFKKKLWCFYCFVCRQNFLLKIKNTDYWLEVTKLTIAPITVDMTTF